MSQLNNLSILPFYEVTSDNPTPRDCQKWWAYGDVWPLVTPGIPPMQILGTVNSFDLFPWWPNRGAGITSLGAAWLQTKSIGGNSYDFGNEQTFGSWPEGRYYLETRINGKYCVSDVFTVVHDLTNYLKIEWWDDDDFIMDGGVLVYKNAGGSFQYKNTLYLQADLAKPDYVFEEEGENRDGYFFPIKQISEKRYRFRFLAPEYILDVMRFIRMSDHIVITYRGQQFYPDTFLMTPSWEGNGNLANVDCEFDTNTVAKKIGRLITP